MAGDWIKVRTDLGDDPAVLAIAADLGVDRRHVLGALVLVWSWADRQLEDGQAPSVARPFLDELAGRTGFADAMERAGWLESDGDLVAFPKFDRHMGHGAKKRALDADRKRSGRMSAFKADISRTKRGPEKRREEKKKNPPPPTAGPPGGARGKPGKITDDPYQGEAVPSSLDRPEFHLAWAAYQRTRAEYRMPRWKPVTIRRHLGSLAALGPERAAACLDYSAAAPYRGIFPERFQKGGDARKNGRADYDFDKAFSEAIRPNPKEAELWDAK